MTTKLVFQHGPADAAVPLVLHSPHSGREFPADFDAAVSEFDLREGEDCFVDELYAPATELGVPLLAALYPRTYLDPNRHQGDIDLELIEGAHRGAAGSSDCPTGLMNWWNYSHGMKQRLVMASSLLREPKVLVVDEGPWWDWIPAARGW